MVNDVEKVLLTDDGTFPNNDRLPVIVYRQAVEMRGDDPAAHFEDAFGKHGWGDLWRNGIYEYHHYHSTAHEVLGMARGSASVQLGGDSGNTFDLGAGDVVVIPAGVAHKNLQSSPDFQVVGAYPSGQTFDMNYGHDGERPQADRNIERVPVPECDPVFGKDGPLLDAWR